MKFKEAARKVEESIDETLAYCDFPYEHWTWIHTHNAIERLNREIRRRTRAIDCFLDGNSARMLVCARLCYVAGTQWDCKKYMTMKHLDDVEHTEITARPRQVAHGNPLAKDFVSGFATLDKSLSVCILITSF